MNRYLKATIISFLLGSASLVAAQNVYPPHGGGGGVQSITGVTDEIRVTGTTGAIIGIYPNAVMPGVAGVVVPRGATGDRPLVPTRGMLRYNTTLSSFECYNGAWQSLPGSGGVPSGQIIPVQGVPGSGALAPGMNFCDATAGNATDMLPSAVGIAGTIIDVKKIDLTAHSINVTPVPGQTIDGGPNYLVTQPMDEIAFVSDGSNWFIR